LHQIPTLDWAKKFDEPLKTILDAEGHPVFGNYGGAQFILFGDIKCAFASLP
jgi:hypothetical protein